MVPRINLPENFRPPSDSADGCAGCNGLGQALSLGPVLETANAPRWHRGIQFPARGAWPSNAHRMTPPMSRSLNPRCNSCAAATTAILRLVRSPHNASSPEFAGSEPGRSYHTHRPGGQLCCHLRTAYRRISGRSWPLYGEQWRFRPWQTPSKQGFSRRTTSIVVIAPSSNAFPRRACYSTRQDHSRPETKLSDPISTICCDRYPIETLLQYRMNVPFVCANLSRCVGLSASKSSII
jgi:hypothetical protein